MQGEREVPFGKCARLTSSTKPSLQRGHVGLGVMSGRISMEQVWQKYMGGA